VGMDYKKHAKQTATNGEPGYFWLENAQKYGRLKDGETWADSYASGTNPCITGDTLVSVADGRKHVTIKEMVDNEEDNVPVYCIGNDGTLQIRLMRHPRITGYSEPIYKVILDNGCSVRVTGNHKFRMKNHEYKEVKDLVCGNSLHIFHSYVESPTGYDQVGFGPDLGEYRAEHSVGENNLNHSGITNQQLIDNGCKLCKKLGRAFYYNEWRIFARKNELIEQILGYRWDELKNFKEFSKECADQVGVPHYNLNIDKKTIDHYEKLLDDGWNTFIKDNKVYVKKVCEFCDKEFPTHHSNREVSYCSVSCGNRARYKVCDKLVKETETLRYNQIKYFNELKFKLGRDPYIREWRNGCKEIGLIANLRRNFDDKWKTFKEATRDFNHKVVSVELDGYEDVYNGTVDDFHNFFIGGFDELTSGGRRKYCYINNLNCGEQTLESFECCNLVETFPSRHDTFEEYKRTLKYAYLYGKCITLVSTHHERTNQIMLRNRRIGLSMSGITEAFEKFGRREFFGWCDKGYSYINSLDELYSRWLCIPESIKKTSIKPSGSVSLLPGVTPGIHYPHSEYYMRSIRITKGSPIIKVCEKANYRIEDSIAADNSVVVYFPVKSENFNRSKKDVTIWEQVENTAAMQHIWSDNQVSVTVTFNKHEAKDIHRVLELYESKLKAISFLPSGNDHRYKQPPYQEITKEEYEEYKAVIKPLEFKTINTDEEQEKFCDGENCVV